MLVFHKVWVRWCEGFWVLSLDLKDLKLRSWNFVFNGETQFWGIVFSTSKAFFLNGIPSPIYREGVRSVWREKEGLSLIKWWRSKACSKVEHVRQELSASNLVCTPTQFVCILAWKGRDKDGLIKVVVVLAFKHFGKIFTFEHNSGLITWDIFPTKLTCKCVLEFFAMSLGSNEIRTCEFGGLVHQNAKTI